MARLDTRANSAITYTRTAIALHWVLAAALIAQIVLGWWMLGVPKAPAGLRAGWFNIHKSVGITLALLIAVRIAWRASHRVEQLPLAAGHSALAEAAHGALYACMVLMPLTGFLGSSFTRYPIRYFGWAVPTPHADWPAAKELMADFHYAVAWAFVVLIAIHVAAAAWHWLRRDGVPGRMGIPSLR